MYCFSIIKNKDKLCCADLHLGVFLAHANWPIIFKEIVSFDIITFTQLILSEPRREKTGLRGFRPGPTQTGLYKLRKELEA